MTAPHQSPAHSPTGLPPANGLVWGGSLALVCVSAWFWFNSPWSSLGFNALAVGICVLGALPMILWLKRNDLSYPLPELMQLTIVPFYAIPIFSEHEGIMGYNEEVLTKAALLVVVFQVFLMLGSFFSSRTARPADGRSLWHLEFVGEDNLRFTSYTLLSTTLWLLISVFTTIVPREYLGTLRAIFFGVGILSNFIQARMWGAGRLNSSQKAFFIVNILLQVILHSMSLLLITGLTTTLLAIVGYFSAARRIPWIVCLVGLAVFGVLHNGKHQMRKLYWEENPRPLTMLDVPVYFTEWVEYGLSATGENDIPAPGSQSRANLFQRASLIQLVAYAVDTVPMPTPYLDGATYALIPPQIFPRFLWPNKPSPNDSVKMISIRLGILSEEQAETTSVGYGLITESYVNLGFYGTGLLGLVIGWMLRRVALATAECSTLSFGGIFRILCLAWCLNTETTLAVWLSSFYQACIAIFVPLFFLQSLFK